MERTQEAIYYKREFSNKCILMFLMFLMFFMIYFKNSIGFNK